MEGEGGGYENRLNKAYVLTLGLTPFHWIFFSVRTSPRYVTYVGESGEYWDVGQMGQCLHAGISYVFR